MDTNYKEKERLTLINTIVSSLEEHPEWLNDVLNAISYGMGKALENANEKRAQYDLAFRCALSLSDPKRLSPETKNLLNWKICEVLEGNTTCKVEKEFLERVAEEQES